MSIYTTVKIRREEAIKRIEKINAMVLDRDYRGVEAASFEPDNDVEDFVNFHAALVTNLEKWTNGMLEKMMDRPFFRHDNSTNYIVVDSL